MGSNHKKNNSENNNWHWLTDWYQYRKSTRTWGQKLSDDLASLMGSWKFIIFQSCFLLAWLGFNFYGYWHHWDPYPFVFLNLVVAIQAAYAAPIIMMAQNRQSERDRLQAEADFRTNKQAKSEIEQLQLAIARIETEQLAEILRRLPAKKATPKAKPTPKKPANPKKAK